jgi:hypothetical protein
LWPVLPPPPPPLPPGLPAHPTLSSPNLQLTQLLPALPIPIPLLIAGGRAAQAAQAGQGAGQQAGPGGPHSRGGQGQCHTRSWGRGSASLECGAALSDASSLHHGAGSVPRSVLGLHSVRVLSRCHNRVWCGKLTHPRHLLHPPPPPHHSHSVAGRRGPRGRRTRRWRAGRVRAGSTTRWVVKYGSVCRCHARVWARVSALLECGPSTLVCGQHAML